MLDVARVNAMTVRYINKGLAPSEPEADERFTKGWELAMALIKPLVVHRLRQRFKNYRSFAKVDDAFPGRTSCYLSTSGSSAPAIQEALRVECR